MDNKDWYCRLNISKDRAKQQIRKKSLDSDRLKQVVYMYHNLNEQTEMQTVGWHLVSNHFDKNFLNSNFSEER